MHDASDFPFLGTDEGTCPANPLKRWLLHATTEYPVFSVLIVCGFLSLLLACIQSCAQDRHLRDETDREQEKIRTALIEAIPFALRVSVKQQRHQCQHCDELHLKDGAYRVEIFFSTERAKNRYKSRLIGIIT